MNAFTAEFKVFLGVVLLSLFVLQDWYVFEQGKKVQIADTAVAQSKQKDKVITAVIDNSKENAATGEKQEVINRKVSNETESERTAVRDFKPAARGLQFTANHSTGGCQVAAATEATSTGKPNAEVAITMLLPEEITEELRADAKHADEIVTEFRGLQKWVRQQGFFGPVEPIDIESDEESENPEPIP